MTGETLLAVATRARVAALAIVRNGEITRIRRRHLGHAPREERAAYLAEAIRRLVIREKVTAIIVEPGSIAEVAAREVGLQTRSLELAEAKRLLRTHSPWPVSQPFH